MDFAGVFGDAPRIQRHLIRRGVTTAPPSPQGEGIAEHDAGSYPKRALPPLAPPRLRDFGEKQSHCSGAPTPFYNIVLYRVAGRLKSGRVGFLCAFWAY